MTEKEHEFKMLLTNREYQFLLQLFDHLMTESEAQTNYYYDTRDEAMRKNNVTVRVREKNRRLTGTIKQHLETGHCSLEKHFHVDTIPQVIILDSMPVFLKGSLKTDRKVAQVGEGITLTLDQNHNLDTVDYELEHEYTLPFYKQAQGVLMLINSLLQNQEKREVVSKSERFFRRLHLNGGVSYD